MSVISMDFRHGFARMLQLKYVLGNPGKTQGAGEDQRLFLTIYAMFGAFDLGHEKR